MLTLYKQQPVKLTRLIITKQGEKSMQFNISQLDLGLIKTELQTILKPHLDVFEGGRKTRIDIRSYSDSKNRNSISLNFYGLSVEETYKILIDSIK